MEEIVRLAMSAGLRYRAIRTQSLEGTLAMSASPGGRSGWLIYVGP